MAEIIIDAQNVSKLYRLGQHQNTGHMRLFLEERLRKPFRRFRTNSNAPAPQNRAFSCNVGYIWALKNVSFQIHHREIVGIIGQNGSGKSVLLKILSRITRPTRGCVNVRGRVGSLLEVGTGFHPELTGRENIFLSGAILGMKRLEIERKFDEIVTFSEIEKFLDTPVKRYSNGMRVRLAFSVAAQLEPDILLIDEVLAVGDESFQQKCLKKLQAAALSGRTVLFVSHNMKTVNRLCPRTILLHNGSIIMDGNTSEVTKQYLQESKSEEETITESQVEI